MTDTLKGSVCCIPLQIAAQLDPIASAGCCAPELKTGVEKIADLRMTLKAWDKLNIQSGKQHSFEDKQNDRHHQSTAEL
jgi:hypothetical protein